MSVSLLQPIFKNLEKYHKPTETDINEIEHAYKYIVTVFSNHNDSIFYIEHAISVANLIASWGLDLPIIIAALLHDIPIRDFQSMEILRNELDEDIFNFLSGFKEVQEQIKQLEECNITSDEASNYYNYSYQESFYIKIAERIDILTRKTTAPDNESILLAKKTREILIPQVKRIHAYKLAEDIDELCLQLENSSAYNMIVEAIKETTITCGYYRHHFLTKMDQIFDPNSNIVHEDLKQIQPFIKLFFHEKRSVASLQRYITHTDSSSDNWTNDVEKIKNISHTALYDFTLIIDDFAINSIHLSAVDIFIKYYLLALQPYGVFLHGYYFSSAKNAHYFLICDPMKNMYRLFIRYNSDYLAYRFGDTFAEDSYNVRLVPTKDSNLIKVFKRDGRAEFIKKGATVLDLAFAIHEDLGYRFAHAKLNGNKEFFPAHTVLNNGDTAEIIVDQKANVELNWFRYAKTELAINKLIKYYKRNNIQLGNEIRIRTKDGSYASIPDGSTVLDYAFMIHGDLGYHCDYAIINSLKTHFSIGHILSDGDQVVIVESDDIQPEYYWFRHAKTEKATNYLISYFKKRYSTE